MLTSICQFDFLALITAAVDAAAATERAVLDVAYPNYARADGSRANPAAAVLVSDSDARAALVPGANDQRLAAVLVLADRIASREGQRYWGWEGYTDERVKAFLAAVPT